MPRVTLEMRQQRVAISLEVIGMHALVPVLGPEVVVRKIHHLSGSSRHDQGIVLDVPVVDSLGQRVENHVLTLLALSERLLGVLAIRDVGEREYVLLVAEGLAVDLQRHAVRARALDALGLEFSRHLHALAHQRVDVARPVLAPFGYVPESIGDGKSGLECFFRELEQLEEFPVERHHVEIGIEHADPLVHVLEGRFENQ